MKEALACIVLEVLILQLAALEDKEESPPADLCDMEFHGIHIARGHCRCHTELSTSYFNACTQEGCGSCIHIEEAGKQTKSLRFKPWTGLSTLGICCELSKAGIGGVPGQDS